MANALEFKKVLLVDDDPDLAGVLKVLLENRVAGLTCVSDYTQACAVLEKSDFDLAIFDFERVRGLDLLKRYSKDLPCVVISLQKLSPENELQALELGAIAYVPKDEFSRFPDYLIQLFSGTTLKTESGYRWFTGASTAMKHVDPRAGQLHSVIHALTGRSTSDIIVTNTISGSWARLGQMKAASDLDIEAGYIVWQDRGSMDSLFDPDSAEIKKLVAFFRNHLEQVRKERRELVFVELKAGESRDPTTGLMKGIKWRLEDVLCGSLEVPTPEGPRLITLEEAFATDARIKVDWAVPNPTPDGTNAEGYVEASLIIRLGMKVGNNQARLRVSEIEYGELPLARRTTIALSPVDMSLANEVSAGTHSIPIEHTYRKFLCAVQSKCLDGDDRLKLVKLMFVLLQFWDDIAEYNLLNAASEITQDLSNDFLDVIQTPELIDLVGEKAQMEILSRLETMNIELPQDQRERTLEAFQAKYNMKECTSLDMANFLRRKINDVIDARLDEMPHLLRYIAFVTQRIPYAYGELSPAPVFLAWRIDERVTQKLGRLIALWQKSYPHLKFIHPSDAHITIHFMGLMSDTAVEAVSRLASKITEPKQFKAGGVHFMGRRLQVLSMVYRCKPEVAELVNLLRAKVVSLGAVPERHTTYYKPHVTIAYIDMASPASKRDAHRFLQEDMSQLAELEVSQMEVLTRVDAPQDAPVYRIWRERE